ncbi:MAG: hypothetical protein WBF90_25350 [Rivularia sp. (in: cyanobacteria)]|jgi:hypothetical protein
MTNQNNASVNIGGSVNNSKGKSGQIKSVNGTESTVNDVSFNVSKDVTDGSEIEAGTIEVSESIDIAKLKEELKSEFQPIIAQLAQSEITRNEAVATEAIKQEIKKKPELKQRLLSGLKAGGIEMLKAVFKNPAVAISVETIKGFLEAN